MVWQGLHAYMRRAQLFYGKPYQLYDADRTFLVAILLFEFGSAILGLRLRLWIMKKID